MNLDPQLTLYTKIVIHSSVREKTSKLLEENTKNL